MDARNEPIPGMPAAMPPAMPPATPAAGPLSEADFQAVRQAAARRRAIKTAARIANLSATVTIVLGVIVFFLALWSQSFASAVAAIIVCAAGLVEFLGYCRMRRAQRSAPVILGTNQLVLLGLIIIWCVVQMATFTPETAKGLMSPEFRSQLSAAMPELEQWIDKQVPIFYYGFYSLVIVGSIGFQGGLALYYLTRRKHIDAYNRDTPPWVARLFSEMGV